MKSLEAVVRPLSLIMVLTAAGAWAMAGAWVVRGAWAAADAPTFERLRGIYLQQEVELATVDDRPILLTRMTKFRRCGSRRGMAEDFNDHVVEVLGRDVPGVGFVAGIVDAVEGCETQTGRQPRDLNGR